MYPFHAGGSRDKSRQDRRGHGQRHGQHATGDRDKAKTRGTVSKKKREVYNAFLESLSLTEPVEKLWERLNGFAHHHRGEETSAHTRSGFENLLQEFESVMGKFRYILVGLRKLFDEILRGGPDRLPPKGQDAEMATPTIFSITDAEDLLGHLNDDHIARSYFLGRADERWIGWFRENGIFGFLSEGRMTVPDEKAVPPEIFYLFRVASRRPGEVAAIISEAVISEKSCDASIIWSLFAIISLLPVPELVQLMPKIRNEEWVKILGKQGVREFGYHEIVAKIRATRDNKSFLLLAEALLTLRPRESLEQASFQDQNPLCFSDLSYKSFFEQLAAVDNGYVKHALSLVLRTLGGIIERRGKRGESATFEIFDNLFLADVNFFDAAMDTNHHTSPDNDAHKLAGALWSLTNRFVRLSQSEQASLIEFCATNIDTLPDSWAAWRIRLFFWGSAPDIFLAKLHQALCRALTHDGIREFMMGAEYLHALERSFSLLSSDDQRKFVRRVLALARYDGCEVLVGRTLSMVQECLTPEEIEDARLQGAPVVSRSTPAPLLGQLRGEPHFPKHPMSQDDLKRFTVPNIVAQLKNAWRPDKLDESGDGTWRTPSAEGVGNMLMLDIRDRPTEYARHARLLFDRNVLDPHYTCVCLDEIRSVIRNQSGIRSDMDVEAIVACCLDIVKSHKASLLDRGRREGGDGFVSSLGWWLSVLFSAISIVREILYEGNDPVLRDLKALRDDIIYVIAYFLSLSDSPSPDGTCVMNPSSESTSYDIPEDDPLGAEIDSLREIALEALVLLAHRETKPRDAVAGQEKLAGDIRNLFEGTLDNKPTRAIMLLCGRYFPTLWTWDNQWGMGLLARVFPDAPEKRRLFEAAWRGYLSREPAMSIRAVPEIREIYRRGGKTLNDMDRSGDLFGELSQELVYHALTFFLQCPKSDPGYKIFASFWHQGLVDLRVVFVRRAGEIAFKDNVARDEDVKCKLRELWCDAIKKQPKVVLREFGSWINTNSDIIEPSRLARFVNKTLQATAGELSRPTGLMRSSVDLAKHAPVDTIEIARCHLPWLGRQDGYIFPPLTPDSEWFKATQELFLRSPTETEFLVGELVMVNGQRFEILRQALSDPRQTAQE